MYDRDQYFFEAIAAGAAGYVLKQQADRDVVEPPAAVRFATNRSSTRPPSARSCAGYLERVARGEQPGRGPLSPA